MEIQVGTEAETVHVGLRVVSQFIEAQGLQVTVLVDVADVEEVVHLVGTAAEVGAQTGLGGEPLEHHAVKIFLNAARPPSAKNRISRSSGSG